MKGGVLHVVVAGEVGGAERMLVNLATDTRRAHSVALLTPSHRLRALFHEAGLAVDDRGPVEEGPLSYLGAALGAREVMWIAGVIGRRRAQIVHLHTFASQVVGTRAARERGARVVRTEHSARVYDDPTCWPFSRWSLRRADASVCISDWVQRTAIAKAPWAAPKMSVVPNGVDVERFASRAQRTDTGTKRRVRFLSLGRLDKRKGLDIALRALARVPGAELDVVGDGDEKESLVALSRQLGVADRVRFLGFMEDVRATIAESDLALSSARSEGLGIALLEAMAMGRAVVALPTGGVPEIVAHGDNGWLAYGRNAEALARMMQEAVDHPEEIRLRGARARTRIEARFSIEAMRRGYEDVYDTLD